MICIAFGLCVVFRERKLPINKGQVSQTFWRTSAKISNRSKPSQIRCVWCHNVGVCKARTDFSVVLYCTDGQFKLTEHFQTLFPERTFILSSRDVEPTNYVLGHRLRTFGYYFVCPKLLFQSFWRFLIKLNIPVN